SSAPWRKRERPVPVRHVIPANAGIQDGSRLGSGDRRDVQRRDRYGVRYAFGGDGVSTKLATPPGTRADERGFDVERIREDFPILRTRVNGNPLVFLDNAASSQMPQPVIDRYVRYRTSEHANIHRGVHYLSEVATREYEAVRGRVRAWLNARDEREIVYTSGTTDSINLVMHGYGRKFIGSGDEIIVSVLEHHSNIVPWQMLAEEKGARIRVVPCNDAGELDIDAYRKLFNAHTRLVAVAHVANALGTVNPIADMVAIAHGHGVPVLVDGAQGAPHLRVDVQALDCDFYAFSGHKMCGPTG